jgi:REP element-mobilizing transposase RayT
VSGKIRVAMIHFNLYIVSKNFMATRYRFGDSQYPHFITFAVINWIDALSRPIYKDIIVNSLKHCQQENGLIINGWIIMSNYVHLIARSKPDFQLADTMRDLQKLRVKK